MRLSLITMFTLVAGSASAAPKKSVFLMPPRAINVDAAVTQATMAKLAELLGTRPELEVVTSEELKSVLTLEKTRTAMGCDNDEECVTRVGEATKADLVIVTTVGKIGKSFALTLTISNPAQAAPIGRASETVPKVEDLDRGLRSALGQLFGWKAFKQTVSYRLPKGKKVSFAILDLKPTGVEKDIAENLTQLLSAEIKKIEGTTVVSRDDLTAILSLDKLNQMVGEECDTSCVAELGGALGVDKLITGQIGKLGESFFVSLRLIDPAEVRTDNRVTESYKGTEDMLIRAVAFTGRRLVGVETKTPGNLVVTASQDEADVFVDNEKVGRLPMPPIKELTVGRHSLRVVREGFFEWQQDAYVVPGDTTALWAELQARPEQWYEKWWVWTIAGAVVVGATVATVLLALPGDNLGMGAAEIP